MSSRADKLPLPLLILGSALGGVALTLSWQWSMQQKQKKQPDPETDYRIGHQLVWSNIRGALCSAMIYVGDRLELYTTLREMCREPGSSVTAISLAKETGLNQRWLREWLAQQAAMGVLLLLPGTGDKDSDLFYRLPAATAEVLANPDSKEYDVGMIQAVPSLVNRAKTMIPEAMRTGIGLAYNEAEVAAGIDRHHRKHIRDVFIPKVLTKALDGKVVSMLEEGCTVCDLGCGAGNMIIALAELFAKSAFHGFEISAVALQKAAYNSASKKLTNVQWHDANEKGQSLGDFKDEFDLALTLDVLHDSTQPVALIRQVNTALKPNRGVWLLADIPALESTRDNLSNDKSEPETEFSFSLCLCMSCSLSEEGGAGLGTLGFSIPVALKMLNEGGFENVDVIFEDENTRWFQVR